MIPIESLSFPVNYTQITEEICRARGIDPHQFLRDTLKLSDSQLNDPHATISGSQFHAQMKLIAEFILESPAHQQLLIDFFPATIHGFIALAAMTSDTIGSAIDVALRYAHQVMPAFKMSYCVEQDQCQMYFERVAEIAPYNELMTEIVFCALHSFLRMFGQHKASLELNLLHNTLILTELPTLYSNLHITMSGSENCLSFPAHFLKAKLATRNEATRLVIEKALEENEIRLKQQHSLSHQVYGIILAKLQQQCPVDANMIAKELAMSGRTFSRRLLEEETSFRKLHNNCRCHISKQLLANSQLSISEVSEQLGFSDEGNFSRFFKQQTGLSPLLFRKQGSDKA